MRIILIALLAACSPTELKPIVEHPISDTPHTAPLAQPQPKRLICDFDEWTKKITCR